MNKLWRAIRSVIYPWYLERDPDERFRRWVRETQEGRDKAEPLRRMLEEDLVKLEARRKTDA
jgi:hypothetical protein